MRNSAKQCADVRTVGFHSRRCLRTGVVERNGKDWCRQHDPEAVAARRAAREAKWDAEWKARDAARDREDRISAARDAVIEAARVLAAATTDEGGTIEPGTMGPAELRAVGDAEEAIRAAVRELDEAEAAK